MSEGIIGMQRMIITLILLGLLICPPFGLEGMGHIVLCFGADGHIAVETVPNGHCSNFMRVSTYTTQQSTQIIGRDFTGDHCGSCVDISVSIGSLNEHFAPILKKFFKKQLMVSTHSVCAASTFTKILTEDLLLFSSHAVNVTLISLRTVNLLS